MNRSCIGAKFLGRAAFSSACSAGEWPFATTSGSAPGPAEILEREVTGPMIVPNAPTTGITWIASLNGTAVHSSQRGAPGAPQLHAHGGFGPVTAEDPQTGGKMPCTLGGLANRKGLPSHAVSDTTTFYKPRLFRCAVSPVQPGSGDVAL